MFDSGVVIAWWRKACRGTTVGELHRSWSYGTGLKSIVSERWHFNFIALTSIFVTMVSIDGPLLQRASSVVTQEYFDNPMITVNLNPNMDLSKLNTGVHTGRNGDVSLLSTSFIPIVQNYSAHEPIYLGYSGCNGTCTTEIIGPGFDVACIRSASDLVLTQTPGAQREILGFSFSFNGKYGDPGLITLNTTLRATDTPDRLSTQLCNFRLSQVHYQVQLNNGTVKRLPSAAGNNTIKIERLNYTENALGQTSMLGGLYLIAQAKWGGKASFYVNGAPYQLLPYGETVLTYLVRPKAGEYTWTDPTDVFIEGMRELLFRTAIAASATDWDFVTAGNTTAKTNMTGAQQTVKATDHSYRAVYDSNYAYLGGAVFVMLAAIASTSTILYGWWQLPRAFTLGPFEVAKAFNAPWLKNEDFYGTGDKTFKGLESRQIRYGRILDGESGGRLEGNGDRVWRTDSGSDIELMGYQGSGEAEFLIGMGSPDSVTGC